MLQESIFGRKGEILRHFGRFAAFVPQNDNFSDDLLSDVLRFLQLL
jgi:hypothetical protein